MTQSEKQQQKELSQVESWIRKSNEDFTDWEFDGQECVIFNGEETERYTREELLEAGVILVCYVVTDIDYDTDGEDVPNLKKTFEFDFPQSMDKEEVDQRISDLISNLSGYCHKGFSVTPEFY